MTSRERVKTTLSHREPDRVPWGEFCVDYDTVERVLGHRSYLRAKARSTIAFWERRRDEVVESWKEDLIEFHRQLPVFDIINLSGGFQGLAPPRGYSPEAPRKIDDSTYEYRDGRVLKYSPVTGDFTVVQQDPEKKWALEFRPEDFSLTPEVKPPDPSVFEVVDAVMAAFPDKYIISPSGGSAALVLLGGMERGLYEYAANPGLVRRATEAAVIGANLEDRYLLRPGADAVLWGTDYACNTGPLISPQSFRELCLPALQARVKAVKEGFGLPVFHHACGNNWALLDCFVEAGIDCYQSIQESAGMDLEPLKRAYGRELTLWGGVQVEALVSGTPEDVRRGVRRALAAGKPGGGYIFGASHSIAVGTRYENFIAMLEEFERLRDY